MTDQNIYRHARQESPVTSSNSPPFFRSLRFRYSLGLLFFLAVAGYLLWEEHKVHIVENGLIILLLSVCVGMHLFMHGGHGHSHAEGESCANDDDGTTDVEDGRVEK